MDREESRAEQSRAEQSRAEQSREMAVAATCDDLARLRGNLN